tara:strand:- start:45 stop:242 length:198 start_codon:yes stop_codon:yes gene_type:complete
MDQYEDFLKGQGFDSWDQNRKNKGRELWESVFGNTLKPDSELTETQKIGKRFLEIAKQHEQTKNS